MKCKWLMNQECSNIYSRCSQNVISPNRTDSTKTMPRITTVLRQSRKAIQDLDLLKVLQSEIRYEQSLNPDLVLFASPSFLHLYPYSYESLIGRLTVLAFV